MAQEGGKSEIGAVFIGLEPDLTKLLAGLKQAEAESAASGKKIADGFKDGTGSALPPDTNLPGNRPPPQVKADDLGGKAFDEVNEKADGLLQRLNSVARQAMQVVRMFGFMAAAAQGVVTVVSSIFNYFNSAEIAATRFLASIGEGVGDGAEDRLKAIRQQIIELDKVIDKKSDRSVFGQVRDFFSDDTINKAKGQQQELYAALRRGDKQFQVQLAIREEAVRLNSKQEAQEFADEMAAAERDRELKRKEEQSKAENELRDERIANAKRIQDENEDAIGGPMAGLQRKTNEELAELGRMKRYGDDMEKILAEAAERALIEGSARAAKKIQDVFENAFLDAINGALQASGGTGSSAFANMTVQLSEIAAVTRAINMNIPRDSP